MSRFSMKTTSSPRSLASSLLLYGPTPTLYGLFFSFLHISGTLRERLLYSFNFLAGGVERYREEAGSLTLRISYHQNHAGVKVPQMSLRKAIAGPKSHFPSKPGKKRDLQAKVFSGRLPTGLLIQCKAMTDI
ncbi:hypothetical protein CDAR_619511 [Caerostris darwini]|uniref:Uncharacterized protein n=1 Tax=Caerostris darwini TaxID=1538125 RepID=A0AAV4TXQ6_9ARAC|nr:hypothetical protein CDAR_619511 [Caerostris darwini]